jgi:hypothetical protein
LNPRTAEGVALILIGVIALGLYLGLAYAFLAPYEPLHYSSLPENPTYVALIYNVTAYLYPKNESAWVLLMVRYNQTSQLAYMGMTTYAVYPLRFGGSTDLLSQLGGLIVQPTYVFESSQPYLATQDELGGLPHQVIFLRGSPHAVAVLAGNFTTPSGLIGSETAYYSLANGVLLEASIGFSYPNGTPYSLATYELYNETLLGSRSGGLYIVKAPLLYLTFGVLAFVAGTGIVVGTQRVLSPA